MPEGLAGQVPLGVSPNVTERPESRPESWLESKLHSRLAARVLLSLGREESGKAVLAGKVGHKTVSGELKKQITRLAG